MFTCNFRPYEGNEKYIFISYAHKDSDMVYPIIERINADGYRVWFDDGISPGSEWPEYIANHIAQCELLIFFASPYSAESENCRREINFALSRKKKFFTVTLVPTTLSLGIEMQLSSQQNIMYYEYSDKENFFKTLYDAPSIAPCKVSSDSASVSSKETDSVANMPIINSVPTVSDAPLSNSEPDTTDSSSYSAPVSSASYDYTESGEEDESYIPDSGKKIKKGAIFGIIAAAVGILFLLFLVVAGVILFVVLGRNVTLSNGKTFEKNSEYVFLSKTQLTKSDINKLNKMRKVTSLAFDSVTFEDGAALNTYKHFEQLENLTVIDSNVTDYSFLAASTSLRNLTLTNEPAFNDLSVVHSSALSRVELDNVGITSLTLSPEVDSLYSLSIKNCNLTQLPSALPNTISRLTLSGCNLTDVDFLGASEFSNVYSIDLSNNQIGDCSFLATYYEDLWELNLSDNPISPSSLSIIMNCESLQSLTLDGIKMEDLSVTANMSELEELSLVNCGLTSLANGASGLPLNKLFLKNNNLTSLDGLNSLFSNDTELLGQVEVVDLSYNDLKTLSGLPAIEYEMLIIYANPIQFNEENNADVLSAATFSVLLSDYSDGLENVKFNTECNLFIDTEKPEVIQRFDGKPNVTASAQYSLQGFDERLEKNGYSYIFWN